MQHFLTYLLRVPHLLQSTKSKPAGSFLLLTFHLIDQPTFNRCCGCSRYTTTLFLTSPPIIPYLPELLALLPIPHHHRIRFAILAVLLPSPDPTAMASMHPNQGAPTAPNPPNQPIMMASDHVYLFTLFDNVCALICNALPRLVQKMQA
jgi:hypothetical protein